MPNPDFFTYEPLPYEWMASIVEKKDDLNSTIISKNQSNEKLAMGLILKPIKTSNTSTNLKKSNFSNNEKRRSQTAYAREKQQSMSDLDSAKLNSNSAIKISKLNSFDKLNRNFDDETVVEKNLFMEESGEYEFSEKLDILLKDEIMSYSKKEFSKKIKERWVFCIYLCKFNFED